MKVHGTNQTFVPSNTVKNADRAVQDKQDAAQTKPAVSPVKPAAMVERSAAKLPALLSSLNLPQDNLSRSILAFARFFSLPLESKLLNTLRREVLGQTGKTGQEAAALGSAAAADKGIKLGEKALGEYTAAIEGSLKSFIQDNPAGTPVHSANPDNQEPPEQNPEQGGDSPLGNQKQRSQGEEAGGNFRDPSQENLPHSPEADSQAQPKLQVPALQWQITEILEKRPLLDLINRLTGKNGRWAAIPFSFCKNGLEFTVSLRIFLSKTPFSAETTLSERLTADIKVSGAGKGKHWLITLEKPNPANFAKNSTYPEDRVIIFTEPEYTPADKKNLAKELAKTLGLASNRVYFMERPPLFADSREELLLSIDEKV